MNYDDLTKRFLFGGPVKYQGQRCHVVAMVDSHDELKTLYKVTAGRRKHDSTKKLDQIKKLLAKGKTHQQIADELGLTKGQVDWQVEKIRRAKK